MKNIRLILKKDLVEEKYDIVERKGIGHPDTLSDSLAEHLSNVYSKYTLEKFGAVLHHNFDKVGMMGGKAIVEFGYGKIIQPIRVLLNGRASSQFGDDKIDVKKLLIDATRNFFSERFPMINFDTDVKILYEVADGSSPGGVKGYESKRHSWFSPRSLDDLGELKELNCNDTSMGCAFYGNSKLETIVLNVEKFLNSPDYKKENIWIGSDIKMMGFNDDGIINITMCIPQLCQYVNSIDEYLKNKEKVKRDILNYIDLLFPTNETKLFINTRDKINDKNVDLYLTFTGSSIEMGDEGFVGRGNRMGGLITPRRFYTMEGICGKNPIYHTGKVYCVASYEIAKQISETFNVNCSVGMIGQSGQSLSDPWKITITTDKEINLEECNKIAATVLDNFHSLSLKIINSEYPLC